MLGQGGGNLGKRKTIFSLFCKKTSHKNRHGHLRRNVLHCSFHASFVDLKLKNVRKRLRKTVSDRFETHTGLIFK